MAIKITYSSKFNYRQLSNIVLFVDEKFNTKNLKGVILDSEFSYIKDLLKNSDLKKNILVFEINSKKKIILVSIKKNLKTSDIENLGAEFYGIINSEKKIDYFINIRASGENIAKYLWDELVTVIPKPAYLYHIRLWETSENFFDYKG